MPSSAIGSFVIGESPIGQMTPSAFETAQTIYSQYANSPVLTALICYIGQWYSQYGNIANFYNDVFNVNTAVGFGLDIWGRIVGVNRVIQIPNDNYWGFLEQLPTAEPWGSGVFYLGEALTSNYTMNDTQFRALIFAKAACNISNGSIPSINAILRMLFPGQTTYVADYGNMTMTYYLGFTPTAIQLGLLNALSILKPCGVSASVAQI